MADTVDPNYVKARTALLDALDALAGHRAAVILVGAQAIYLHTEGAAFAVSPFTYDADLALNPEVLENAPSLEEAMLIAGFRLHGEPGLYWNDDGVEVDLLVPEAVGGPGRRGARLGPQHGNRAAKKVHGLEGALVDNHQHTITSLDAADKRTHQIKVAGPAALLIAKLHKLSERIDEHRRELKHKDAFDIYRLLRHIPTTEMSTVLRRLQEHQLSGEVTTEAIKYLDQHFTQPDAIGVSLVVQHVEGLEDPEFIAASCVALSQELLDALQ